LAFLVYIFLFWLCGQAGNKKARLKSRYEASNGLLSRKFKTREIVRKKGRRWLVGWLVGWLVEPQGAA
jgi:hypothetical protein